MPAALSFTAVGVAAAQNVAIAQSTNVGGYAVSTCASGGVTIATAPAATTGTLTVTPVAAGSCAFTITGSNGAAATLQVTVTTTGLVNN